MPTVDFLVSEYGYNEEGSSYATLQLLVDGQVVEERHYFQSFEEPGPSALEGASSFGRMFVESEERRAEADRLGVHPLELEFAPYGPAWQREQDERDEVPF